MDLDRAVGSSARLSVLDGLRGISILLVLGSHTVPLGPKLLRLNDAAGAMGMSLFFALSGFLITSTLLHNADLYRVYGKEAGQDPSACIFLHFYCLHICAF